MALLMRSLLLTVGVAAWTNSQAIAADLPARVPVRAPVADYDWSGIYLGGHGGYGSGRVSWADVQALDTAAEDDTLDGEGPSHRVRGAIAGGHFGAQYQWGAVVMGLEFSGAWAGLTASSCCQFGALDDVYTSRVESIFQVVGRLGIAVGMGHGYVKGGYAGARVGIELTDSIGTPTRGSSKQWHDGFVVGGGLEFAITQNWIAGVDYSYIHLNKADQTLNLIGDGAVTYLIDIPTIHSVVGRISYKFSGPVAARY